MDWPMMFWGEMSTKASAPSTSAARTLPNDTCSATPPQSICCMMRITPESESGVPCGAARRAASGGGGGG